MSVERTMVGGWLIGFFPGLIEPAQAPKTVLPSGVDESINAKRGISIQQYAVSNPGLIHWLQSFLYTYRRLARVGDTRCGKLT